MCIYQDLYHDFLMNCYANLRNRIIPGDLVAYLIHARKYKYFNILSVKGFGISRLKIGRQQTSIIKARSSERNLKREIQT